MEAWLEWARGPAFRASFLILLLGLARVLVLNVASIVTLARKARRSGRRVPARRILVATLQWMLPFKKAVERRWLFSLTSLVFHVAIIITPVFLAAHILLWQRGLGIGWPAISNAAADFLTLIALASSLLLFVERVGARASRAISRAQDYLWPLLIAIPFASGYLAMHPVINPFSYDATMLVHVLSGDLIFVLIPFSKLAHIALFPATQLVSELGWYLEPASGRRVALALGKEDKPI